MGRSSSPSRAPGAAAAQRDDVAVDDDPFAAIAEKYRRDSIDRGRRSGADARLDERCSDDVDAVVVSLPPDDAVFGWDYPALRERCTRIAAMPHAVLAGDPALGAVAEDRERLAT